jgi:hypothetical protein
MLIVVFFVQTPCGLMGSNQRFHVSAMIGNTAGNHFMKPSQTVFTFLSMFSVHCSDIMYVKFRFLGHGYNLANSVDVSSLELDFWANILFLGKLAQIVLESEAPISSQTHTQGKTLS